MVRKNTDRTSDNSIWNPEKDVIHENIIMTNLNIFECR